MRFTTRLAVAAAMVAGLGGLTAFAQPPGGGGRGGFGGGFGSGPAQLINSKTVQAELKVTEEQVGKLQEWGKDFSAKNREKMRELFQGGEFDREKFAAFQAESTKEAYTKIGEVLKPEQVKRLKQIDVQADGMRAFAQKDVQETLKLTDEQKEKIRGFQEASGKELRELAQEFGFGRRGKGEKGERPDPAKMEEFQKKSAALAKDSMDKALASLTDEQKTAWKDLTGESVDVGKIQAESRPQFRRKKDD